MSFVQRRGGRGEGEGEGERREAGGERIYCWFLVVHQSLHIENEVSFLKFLLH